MKLQLCLKVFLKCPPFKKKWKLTDFNFCVTIETKLTL